VYGYAYQAPLTLVDETGLWVPVGLVCRLLPSLCQKITEQITRPAVQYCIKRAREFWKDEQGGRKRDLKEIDDVLRQIEREQSITIDRDMRRTLHDEIHKEFGKGASPTYQELLDLARSLFGK